MGGGELGFSVLFDHDNWQDLNNFSNDYMIEAPNYVVYIIF